MIVLFCRGEAYLKNSEHVVLFFTYYDNPLAVVRHGIVDQLLYSQSQENILYPSALLLLV